MEDGSPGSAQAALMDGMCQEDDYRLGLTQARAGAAGCLWQMSIISQQGMINSVHRSKYAEIKNEKNLKVLMDESVLSELKKENKKTYI